MTELNTKVEELKMASEYQLRLKDMNHNEKTKEISDKFLQEIEQLKLQLQQVKADKDKEETRHAEETNELLAQYGVFFFTPLTRPLGSSWAAWLTAHHRCRHRLSPSLLPRKKKGTRRSWTRCTATRTRR